MYETQENRMEIQANQGRTYDSTFASTSGGLVPLWLLPSCWCVVLGEATKRQHLCLTAQITLWRLQSNAAHRP